MYALTHKDKNQMFYIVSVKWQQTLKFQWKFHVLLKKNHKPRLRQDVGTVGGYATQPSMILWLIRVLKEDRPNATASGVSFLHSFWKSPPPCRGRLTATRLVLSAGWEPSVIYTSFHLWYFCVGIGWRSTCQVDGHFETLTLAGLSKEMHGADGVWIISEQEEGMQRLTVFQNSPEVALSSRHLSLPLKQHSLTACGGKSGLRVSFKHLLCISCWKLEMEPSTRSVGFLTSQKMGKKWQYMFKAFSPSLCSEDILSNTTTGDFTFLACKISIKYIHLSQVVFVKIKQRDIPLHIFWLIVGSQ